MKNAKLHLLNVIILCSLFIVICEINNKINLEKFSIRTVFASVRLNNINVVSKPTQYEYDYIKVNLDIPLVSGINNLEVQNSVNNRIQDLIITSKDNIENLAKEDAKQSIKNGYDVRQYNFFSKYKVNYFKDNILSLTLVLYQYTGGAHGSTNQITYNFDLNTGKIGVLNDFLGNNKNYRSLIVENIRNQILKEPENYFKETINNLNGIPYDQKFYLDSDGVVVYFNEYEIAPYVAGIPEFKIPYATFNEGIKEKINIFNDPVSVSTDTYINKEDNFESYLIYPRIENLRDNGLENKINNKLKKEVFDFNSKIKNMLELSLKNNTKKENDKIWSASTYFKNYFVNEDLISVVITYSANNGSTENFILYDVGYNFDLTTGNLYTLKDVFIEGTNYKELINKEIQSQIKDIELKGNKKNVYKFKSINGNTQFYIENGNLIITFPSGEIASEEYYNPHFVIPLYKFNGAVNEIFIEH